MARILSRPMFRKGGLSRETGIMSGLDSPRRNYAGGGNIGGGIARGVPMGSRTGFQTTNLQGIFDMSKNKSGSQIAQEAAKKVRFQGIRNLLRKFPDLAKRLGTRIPLTLSQSAAAGPVTGMIVPFAAGAGIGTGAGFLTDWATRATDTPEAYAYRKQVVKDDPWAYHETDLEIDDEGNMYTRGSEYDKKIKELDVGEKPGFFPRGGIKKWREDRGLDPVTGEKIVPPAEDKPDLTTDNDLNTQVTGDVESDLMRAYKEYAPIFEKELGVSPEDTKKQLWLQAAKQGFGLAGDPGGDLIGAIGKRAEKGIEGAEKIVSDVSTAKRQAKLLALQTAIREGEAGPIGKAVKDIAKIYNVSEKDAAAIYERWNRNDTTARAAANARYAEQAKNLGLVKDDQNRFISEANEIADKHPELIGQFNNKLPKEEKDWEIGYYVSDTGKFVRVVEKDGKKVAIGMDEPGFSDKEKTKK